jgi:hypothetical protein
MDQKEGLEKELKDLAEENVQVGRVRWLAGIFIGLSLVITYYAFYNTYRMISDRSVPVVVCPREYNLDSPVIMKTINNVGVVGQDRWIRGFIRRYINAIFPRNKEDVNPFFKYVVNHSRGAVKRKYYGYLKDSDEIANIVDTGYYYKFYPKNSTDIRIRPLQDNKNAWAVEVDGYLIKRMNVETERFTPTLRFIVEADLSNLDNPEGLFVTEFNNELITDYVSGRKEEL